MVKKTAKTEPATEKIMPEKIKENKKTPKMSVKRALLTGVMLVVTTAIWYQVGAVVFGFTNSPLKSDTPKKVYSDEMIVAEINGSLVKLKEVRAFVRDVPQLSELPFDEIYPQVLDNMINSRVLLQGAEKTDTQNNPEVKKALKMARDQILSQAYLSHRLEAGMTPENLQALYLEEMKNYERPEEIRARHILVATKKEADDIIVQLKAGADFKTLADKKSLDADNSGGELGYFTQNMMIPEFGKAVFAMKKGELSAPIKTPFGWHVVLVEDKRLAEPPAFELVQDQLKQMYAERNMQKVLQDEREKAGVKIYRPTLK